ncbi:Plant self-incompatibility S1 [Artemisia annua]|uniref:S-protein homolog n=1 Tax=Artemisia annua TaxID=35608 RepID=A0A2U1KUX7_ARTAN|nr:Plant self-incompatibility S1 [Artemisia annua]
MKTFIFFTTLLCIIVAVSAKPKSCWSGGWIVNVVDDINSKELIQVHCKSKDDDIGMKSIGFGQSVDWKFCENIFSPSTLYFCHVYKGSQEQVFDVFNDKIKQTCREKDQKKDYWACTWLIRPDGIYIRDRSQGGETDKKMHEWK